MGGDDDGDGYGDDMEVSPGPRSEARCVFALASIQAKNSVPFLFAVFCVFTQLFKYISHEGTQEHGYPHLQLDANKSSKLVVSLEKFIIFHVNGIMLRINLD